jgi:hypothetical protein
MLECQQTIIHSLDSVNDFAEIDVRDCCFPTICSNIIANYPSSAWVNGIASQTEANYALTSSFSFDG